MAQIPAPIDKILAEQNGVPLSSVQLLCPLPRPGKCIAAFRNYIDRPGRTADNFPHEYFYKSPDLVGPGGAVELRDIPACVVYQPEAEFAYVIGKTTKNVPESKALDFIFGYVPFFDISTRGLLRRTHFIGKGQGSHGCCGPWIITKDEIADPHNVVVKSWTCGEPRQNYNTSAMAHKIPDQISWLSRFITLSPGDIVAGLHEGLSR
jgi:2-keto-4-pentenoate hydratase/2-oxohepta-3-ene-1,7-dioic acid hydratase in catechol pathway